MVLAVDTTSDTTAPVSLNSTAFSYTVLDATRLFATETFALKVAVPVTSIFALKVPTPVRVSVLLATNAELIVGPPDDSKSVVLLDTVNTLLVAFAVKFKPLNVVLPELIGSLPLLVL